MKAGPSRVVVCVALGSHDSVRELIWMNCLIVAIERKRIDELQNAADGTPRGLSSSYAHCASSSSIGTSASGACRAIGACVTNWKNDACGAGVTRGTACASAIQTDAIVRKEFTTSCRWVIHLQTERSSRPTRSATVPREWPGHVLAFSFLRHHPRELGFESYDRIWRSRGPTAVRFSLEHGFVNDHLRCH